MFYAMLKTHCIDGMLRAYADSGSTISLSANFIVLTLCLLHVHFIIPSHVHFTCSLPFGILAQAANAILPDEYKLNKLHPEQLASDDKEQEW